MRIRILCLLLLPLFAARAEDALTPIQRLGKAIFFDTSLSEPAGQSCASCHDPKLGFAGPGIMPGAVTGRIGNRTPPSVAYAVYSPLLHWDKRDKSFSGGQFRDGRAADLAEQAKGPFLNPLEMNNPDGKSVCRKVHLDFTAAFAAPLDCETDGFERIAQALAAYEASREINPFSSKYDAALAGKARLSAQELRGLILYQGKARCEQCHPSKPGPRGEPPLFTDFGYENIGAPAGSGPVDEGLGAVLKRPGEDGKFKAPTLRNIAFPRAFMHNGSLKDLTEVMEFYNERDVAPPRWKPEEPRNLHTGDLGDLKLTGQDQEDIIAFLRTLTDGWNGN